MTYTDTEASYFYWHCATAALVLSSMELNTATRAHASNAIRMATLNAVGKRGVRYASAAAFEKYQLEGKDWSKLGLIREHVFPVSTILAKAVDAHRNEEVYSWRELTHHMVDEDFTRWNVLDSDSHLDSRAPLSAVIAALVRRHTVLAWVTKQENDRLKEEGLSKSMPADYGDDLLARYAVCKIDLVDLQPQGA